ncbi:MAG: SprT family zinc-dependent metalloprotease [Alphaproteobacteria bacterium]|nr:SprT family zinc-dependent metalloprotease [Alphaproteobacteria bacterium]
MNRPFSSWRDADADFAVRDGDAFIPIQFRPHPQARRVSLRIDSKSGAVILTAPARTARRRLLAFVEEHRDWVLEALARLPTARPFADGAVIPVEGQDIRLAWLPEHRGPCILSDATLTVGGDAPHTARRVRDFLKTRARTRIVERVALKAETANLAPGRISIRDQSSRWGSCAANGGLSFNWRLICAPPPVLDYVVAHEVAHLRHMDHGPDFWDLTERLSDGDMAVQRNWLRRHGAALQRLG